MSSQVVPFNTMKIAILFTICNKCKEQFGMQTSIERHGHLKRHAVKVPDTWTEHVRFVKQYSLKKITPPKVEVYAHTDKAVRDEACSEYLFMNT